MDFLSWTSFERIVQRYRGDHRARVLTCAEQFRVMAFAQLTYRESLRDIKTCLSAQANKLYHLSCREPVRRATLADANEALGRETVDHDVSEPVLADEVGDLAERVAGGAHRLA